MGALPTDIMEPNDVDCVLLAGPDFPTRPADQSELYEGWPFLGIDIVGQREFDIMIHQFFAADRLGAPKGMIEVIV